MQKPMDFNITTARKLDEYRKAFMDEHTKNELLERRLAETEAQLKDTRQREQRFKADYDHVLKLNMDLLNQNAQVLESESAMRKELNALLDVKKPKKSWEAIKRDLDRL